MAIRQTIFRYLLILNKIRRAPSTYKEIDDYLCLQSELLGEKLNISKRQFQRDLNEISSIFEVGINYNANNGFYEINEGEYSEISRRRIEALDTFNALKIGEGTLPFIHFENRRPLGTENLFGIIHSIKNKFKIKFSYRKYWEEDTTVRNVDPYSIKEFRGRWYVIAKDQLDNKIKSFALDRLKNLEISGKTFVYPVDFDIEEYYQSCYGIINPDDDQKLQEIILSFNSIQGKYTKSLPLHSSQKILVDNEKELRIKLSLFITYDLVMELLSFGDNVKIIQPESLADQIKSIHRKAFRKYEN